MKSIVPIARFSFGGAGEVFAEVESDHPIVVIKNNRTIGVIVAPEDFEIMSDAVENYRTYHDAADRFTREKGQFYRSRGLSGLDHLPFDDKFFEESAHSE